MHEAAVQTSEIRALSRRAGGSGTRVGIAIAIGDKTLSALARALFSSPQHPMEESTLCTMSSCALLQEKPLLNNHAAMRKDCCGATRIAWATAEVVCNMQ